MNQRIMGASPEPPNPVLVPKQIEELMRESSNETALHSIESAALFHLKFEGIHPFIDGNGRTGRLIMDFSLMQNGYPPIDVKFADRKRYFDCFGNYYLNGDSSPMVMMVAESVKERIEQYLTI